MSPVPVRMPRDRTAPGDVVVQECGAGLVPVGRTADGLAFAASPLLLRSGPVEEPLAEAVLALRPGFVDLDLGVVGPYPPGSPQVFVDL
jgi:hypothetical protein